jgi:transcriptional regulator with XRE-family HTH domain
MEERLRTFGIELRRMRMEVGLSLTQLGKRLHYSKGYLSKVETGQKSPSVELVRRCDAELSANGALISLVKEQPPGMPPSEATAEDGEVWLMNLANGDTGWFRPISRRDALAMSTSSLAGFALSTQGMWATANEPTVLEVFRSLFEQFRNLGQTASPGVVQRLVIAPVHVLRDLADRAPTGVRDEILVLGARFAEYAGWMAQEAGSEEAALWWTDRAVEMAEAGGDNDLAVYALIRRALVTLYRDDADQTIELARRAQVHPGTPRRIRGLAAQREAQGHALAGDHDACMHSLDRARELLASSGDDPAVTELGPTNLTDPVSMVTGWCLYELGRAREAGEILDGEVARIRPQALRTRARYGVRQALAHAAAGEVDHACELTSELLAITDVVSSATIATDLRRLTRLLSRWHQHPPVRDLYPALTASLRTTKV